MQVGRCVSELVVAMILSGAVTVGAPGAQSMPLESGQHDLDAGSALMDMAEPLVVQLLDADCAADAIRKELATIAEARATQARRSCSIEDRIQGLSEAAGLFLYAALPSTRTAPGSPLRREASPAWEGYCRTVWELGDHAGLGIDSALVARLLLPFAGEDPSSRVGPVYAAAYYEPAIQLWYSSWSDAFRMCAAAYVVNRCVLGDWELACNMALDAYELERQFSSTSRVRNSMITHGMDDIFDDVRHQLQDFQTYINDALCVRVHEEGEVREGILLSPNGLWRVVKPYLPQAISARAVGPELEPEWMDLDTNRLTTTPGLRIIGLQWQTEEEGSCPSVLFETVFWEPIDSQHPVPWRGRAAERVSRSSGRN